MRQVRAIKYHGVREGQGAHLDPRVVEAFAAEARSPIAEISRHDQVMGAGVLAGRAGGVPGPTAVVAEHRALEVGC